MNQNTPPLEDGSVAAEEASEEPAPGTPAPRKPSPEKPAWKKRALILAIFVGVIAVLLSSGVQDFLSLEALRENREILLDFAAT